MPPLGETFPHRFCASHPSRYPHPLCPPVRPRPAPFPFWPPCLPNVNLLSIPPPIPYIPLARAPSTRTPVPCIPPARPLHSPSSLSVSDAHLPPGLSTGSAERERTDGHLRARVHLSPTTDASHPSPSDRSHSDSSLPANPRSPSHCLDQPLAPASLTPRPMLPVPRPGVHLRRH